MPTTDDFTASSYQAHEHGYDAYATHGANAEHAKAWLESGTVNSWRFERMYQLADPILRTCPGAHWLTVGDGRFGLDAQYLIAHGEQTLPTDLAITLLAYAKAQGRIADYRRGKCRIAELCRCVF